MSDTIDTSALAGVSAGSGDTPMETADDGGGAVGTPRLTVTLLAPANGAVLPDPATTATVRVRFQVDSNYVRIDSRGVQVGEGTPFVGVVSEGNRVYFADVPVPGHWPTVRITARVVGTITLNGELDGMERTATASVVVSLADGGNPEVRQLSVGVPTDSGRGFLVPVTAVAYDHTSGIREIAWSLNGGPMTTEALGAPPRAEATWSRTLYTPVIGLNSVRVRVTDGSGRVAERDVLVTTQDRTPPTGAILEPVQDQRYVLQPGDPDGVEVVLRGTASDLQSGMSGGAAGVRWRVNGGPWTNVPGAPGWETWQTTLHLRDYGFHTVHVQLRDRDGNARDESVQVQVLSGYRPRTTEELLSPRAYLGSLLEFARDHVSVPGEGPLSTTRLEAVFRQPFGKLAEPLSEFGNQPVSQLRVALEVLRRHLPSQPPLLAGHWKADAAGGAVLADASGRGNHGTLVGGAGWTAGRLGRALSFDGVDDGAVVPHSPSLAVGAGGADFSVAFWMLLRRDFTGAWRAIVHKGRDGTERTFALWLHERTNQIHYRIGTTASPNEGGDSVGEVVAGVWTHVAYVKDGRALRLYLNGVLDSEVTLAGSSVANASPLHIGKGPDCVGFDGCIDDLRVYALPLDADSVRALADGEAGAVPDEGAYRLAAYEALLGRIGTSYEEIRIARGAPPAERAALAERLGLPVPLRGARPDELDDLFREPGQLTEEWLEATFGLARTTRAVDDAPAPPATLLAAQEARLRQLWLSQDHPQEAAPSPVPLLDPDVVGPDDLVVPAAAAGALREARRAALEAQYAAVRAVAPEAAPAVRFAAAVAHVLGPDADLAALEAAEAAGADIAPQLAALGLAADEFAFLGRLRTLAQAGVVTEGEWDGLFHLLVQAWKRGRAAAWRAEERERGISVTPEHFRVDAPDPEPLPWRGSPEARRDWTERLRARADQLRGLREGLAAAVAAVEEATLPLLRDALVASVAGADLVPQVSDELSDRLLVDVRASGAARTTRILQAAETVQGVVFAWRTGRFRPDHPAFGWRVEEEDAGSDDEETNQRARERNFDEEWRWMGSYGGWRAATLVFLYPENILLPHLRPAGEATDAFTALLAGLRERPQVTPADARALAAQYWADVHGRVSAPLRAVLYPAGNALMTTELLTEDELLARRDLSAAAWNGFAGERERIREIFLFVPLLVAAHLQRAGEFVAALDWYQTVYAYNLRPELRKVFTGLEAERNGAPDLARDDHWLRTQLNPHVVARRRPNPYTRYTLLSLAECMLQFGDSEFTRDTRESIATARRLYLLAREVLVLPELQLRRPADGSQALLPNPRMSALRAHAEAQLLKLRQGRNIAGMQRQVEVPSGPDEPDPLLLDRGPESVLRPTPYRFQVLLERGKHLAALAQQVEQVYLATLEKRDAESYTLKKAGFDLALARSGVELQARRQTEARSGRTLAALQTDRARAQERHYGSLLRAGLSAKEKQAIRDLVNVYQFGNMSTVVGGLGAIAGAVAGGMGGSGLGAVVGAISGGLPGVSQVLSGVSQAYATQAQIHNIEAGYERRAQDWEFQRSVANRDAAIGRQHERIADDHLQVVDQEHAIARTQEVHAAAMAEFLATKFTSAELYEWMSGVLGGVYRFFLQQATATARLAEGQLAFERQQRPETIIQSDYWLTREDGPAAGPAQDRRGLTGSARLLQDVYRLDQFAFESDRRKLNLSQTFSLSQLSPIEFQRLRETGVMRFATPARLFDEAFPGHYLRLVKRVRTSVLALVPPAQGIRATLLASGISRVVVGSGDAFREKVIRRDPELVALSSATNASGVFELDTQAEMLLPFESMGVDTTWELQLPRAANAFDYGTLADVLMTVEYTALNSFEYRRQVVQRLDRRVRAEVAFSIRDRFPDAWYDLVNDAEGPSAQAPFRTRREDFPPNLDRLHVQSLMVYFVPREGADVAVRVADLGFPAATGGAGAVLHAGAADATEGIVSTRRGAWAPLLVNGGLLGDWALSFSDAATRQAFRDGDVEDILVVLGYGGETPPWD